MSRYIEREAAIRAIENDCSEAVYYTKRDAIDCIEAQPTADVAEVRHGEWKRDKKFNPYCSVCGEDPWSALIAETHLKYCPNCGAKMDGGK